MRDRTQMQFVVAKIDRIGFSLANTELLPYIAPDMRFKYSNGPKRTWRMERGVAMVESEDPSRSSAARRYHFPRSFWFR
jgi:hypothetical protein